MVAFFKTLGLGVLYTVLSPFLLLLLALYAIYCFIVFVIQAFRNLIVFFSGGTVGGDLPEDVKAKQIQIEKEKAASTPVDPVTPTTTNNTTTNTSTTTTTNNIFIIGDEKKLADILPGVKELSNPTPTGIEEKERPELEVKEAEVKDE